MQNNIINASVFQSTMLIWNVYLSILQFLLPIIQWGGAVIPIVYYNTPNESAVREPATGRFKPGTAFAYYPL